MNVNLFNPFPMGLIDATRGPWPRLARPQIHALTLYHNLHSSQYPKRELYQ
jgi:hypothetical protein